MTKNIVSTVVGIIIAIWLIDIFIFTDKDLVGWIQKIPKTVKELFRGPRDGEPYPPNFGKTSIFLRPKKPQPFLEKGRIEFVKKEGGLVSVRKVVIRLHVPPDYQTAIYRKLSEEDPVECFPCYGRKYYCIELGRVGKDEIELFYFEK